MSLSQPMLAAKLSDVATLRFPCLATPKIDGIRCLKVDGRVLSRSFKPIPNKYIVSLVETLPDGVDGELLAGDFSDTESAVMSRDGEPDFQYWVFDVYSDKPYEARVQDMPSAPWIVQLMPHPLFSLEDFFAYERLCIGAGHEGVMTRAGNSPYKCGRSTPTEQYLVKHKRFDDSEAIIIGFLEQYTNNNEIQRNAFGKARRPGGRANHTPKGTLGSLQVRDVYTGVEFEVGTGFDDALRKKLWTERPLGVAIRYKYQGTTGKRPRFPVFLGFRNHD